MADSDDNAASTYPPQVEIPHAALGRLVAISEITTGLKNLAAYEPSTYSLPGEFGDLPHALLRRTEGGLPDEMWAHTEFNLTRDDAGWADTRIPRVVGPRLITFRAAGAVATDGASAESLRSSTRTYPQVYHRPLRGMHWRRHRPDARRVAGPRRVFIWQYRRLCRGVGIVDTLGGRYNRRRLSASADGRA